MIVHMPGDIPDVRVRAMYPTEGNKRPGDSDGLYYTSPPHEIAIDAALPAEGQAAILIHEIIHAIWQARKMPPRVTEESACAHLGVAFAKIFQDNPDILAALGLALTEGVPIVGASN